MQQIRFIRNFVPSDFEIFHKLDGSAYTMLKELKTWLSGGWVGNYEFSYIIGMDQANNFHTWRKYKDLMKTAKFIVVPRVGEKYSKVNWYKKSPHVYLDSPIMEVSSTQVRNLIGTWWKDNTREDLILEKIDKPVFAYIKKYCLYR